jgi:hypothetical protein
VRLGLDSKYASTRNNRAIDIAILIHWHIMKQVATLKQWLISFLRNRTFPRILSDRGGAD